MDRKIRMGEDYKKILLKLLKSFIDICEEQHLRYFAAYGTLLGAIRHHDIIPWDDDVDVFMPRLDYEKFLLLFLNNYHSELEVVTPYNNKNYNLCFAKLCAKNTTLLENEDYKTTIGAYIDIFPLDGAPESMDKRKTLINKCRIMEAIIYESGYRITYHRIRQILKQKQYSILIYSMLGLHILFRPILLKKIRKICLKYEYDKSSIVASYLLGSNGIHSFFEKSWFDGYLIIPFNDMNIRIPQGYNSYLKQKYGDYMTPLPPEERICIHEVAYVNFKKRLSLKEVINELGNK